MTFQRRFFTLLALGASLWVAACAEHPETDRVKGEVRVRLPWMDGQGDLNLQEVTLTGLENLLEVRGSHARFYYAPKIQEKGLEGASPRAHFIKTANGTYVPADEVSQQMAVVYAHFQRLREFDRKVGAEGLLSWPRKVGVSVRLRGQDGDLWTDNSFYDGASDSLLLVPNKRGQWPLAVNPGVVAHEHFHALFFRLVLGPLLADQVLITNFQPSAHNEQKIRRDFGATPGKRRHRPHRAELESLSLTQEVYHTAFLKVMNEGLADVWGWIYSGQPDFLGKSMPEMKRLRSLRADSGNQGFTERTEIEFRFVQCLNADNPDACINNYSYSPGAELSRALRSIFLGDLQENSVAAETHKVNLARRIISALPKIERYLRVATTEEERLDLPRVLQFILDEGELSTEERLAAKAWLPADTADEGGTP